MDTSFGSRKTLKKNTKLSNLSNLRSKSVDDNLKNESQKKKDFNKNLIQKKNNPIILIKEENLKKNNPNLNSFISTPLSSRVGKSFNNFKKSPLSSRVREYNSTIKKKSARFFDKINKSPVKQNSLENKNDIYRFRRVKKTLEDSNYYSIKNLNDRIKIYKKHGNIEDLHESNISEISDKNNNFSLPKIIKSRYITSRKRKSPVIHHNRNYSDIINISKQKLPILSSKFELNINSTKNLTKKNN